LRATLAIPPESQDILPRLNILRNLDNVNDMPMSIVIIPTLLLMRIERVCSPHGASRSGSLCCLQGCQLSPVPCLPVCTIVDPLKVSHKLKWCPLKALLRGVMGHLAQSVGVTPCMVGTHIPGNFLE